MYYEGIKEMLYAHTYDGILSSHKNEWNLSTMLDGLEDIMLNEVS